MAESLTILGQTENVAVETGQVNLGVASANLLTRENPPEANCRIATEVEKAMQA